MNARMQGGNATARGQMCVHGNPVRTEAFKIGAPSAGTVILTGTPAGVGFARSSPVYLQSGDTVEVC